LRNSPGDCNKPPRSLSNLRQPSPAGQEEILAWCNRYGLLGILPGQALKIHLPPTYERGQDYLPKMGGISESSYRARVYRSYERIAGHWLDYQLAHHDFDLYGSGWTPGQLAPLKDGEKFDTTWWDWIEFEWKTEETVPALQRYFPEPCRNAQYPRLLSEEFWPVYQEPVSEWMRSAITFTHAVELTSNYATQRFSASPGTPNQATQDIGLWRLNALAGSEASYFEFGTYVLQEERSSASLLGAMAKMFLLDVIAGRRLLRCSHCGRFFVTNVQRAKYCSIRCRNTSQSRRYRAGRKAKPTDAA
jgi:hypothetical protein